MTFTPRPRKHSLPGKSPRVGADVPSSVSVAVPPPVPPPAPTHPMSIAGPVAAQPAPTMPTGTGLQAIVQPTATDIAGTAVEAASAVTTAIHWSVFGFGVYGIYRFFTRNKPV